MRINGCPECQNGYLIFCLDSHKVSVGCVGSIVCFGVILLFTAVVSVGVCGFLLFCVLVF